MLEQQFSTFRDQGHVRRGFESWVKDWNSFAYHEKNRFLTAL